MYQDVTQTFPADENGRQDALRLYDLRPGEREPAFDDLARLAALVCGTPLAFLSIVDGDRVWFKAAVGSEATEARRAGSFCGVAVLGDDMLVVPDAAADPRFATSDLVRGGLRARFYAGVPIRTVEGHRVGTLCVLDTRPRELDETAREALRALAEQAAGQLALRRQTLEMRHQRALVDLARRELSEREASIRAIVETSSRELGVARVGLWSFDETRESIVVEDLYSASSGEHSRGARLTAADYPTYFAALAESRTIAAHDSAVDPRTREFAAGYLAEHGVGAMLDVPVRSEGRVIGILCHEHTAGRRVWTAGEQEFAAALADLLGTVIEASRRRRTEDELRELTAELERRVADRTSDLEASNLELARALEDLEAFCYSVSHDLRAPLRVINGFASILEEAGDDPVEVRDAVGRIRANTSRMSELIDDLLSFFRLGRRQMNPQSVDLDVLVRDVVRMLGLDSGGVELAIGELGRADGDRALLGDVFANLLGNAAKFSRGSASPRVEVGCDREGAEPVWFVRDNGVGFVQEQASRLFEPFQRFHALEGFEGTGVGLAIVARIVDRHGGRVWAEGSQGRGATFRFTLGGHPA